MQKDQNGHSQKGSESLWGVQIGKKNKEPKNVKYDHVTSNNTQLLLNWINGRITVAKALLLSQYTYVATVLDLSQKETEYIQSILDNFILYNSFLNHGHKSRYWINQDILYGTKNLGGFNAIRFSDFLLSLKTSWIHRYAVTKVCDHWCDKLDDSGTASRQFWTWLYVWTMEWTFS